MEKRNSSKESHSQLFNRYIWLVDLIFSRGRVGFEEINDRWQRSQLNSRGGELPLRTFHNHREAIQSMFDIDIVCDKRAGYLYYIENAEDLQSGGVRQWLVNTFAVNNLINESHKLKNQILFEEIPSGQRFLTTIIEAMRDSVVLEMSYQSFWMDSPAQFEFEPYCVKVFKQRWYVVGRSDVGLRVYGLDRICALFATGKSYKMPGDFDACVFFEDSFGVVAGEDFVAEKVQFRAYGHKAKYLKTLPLHHSQTVVEEGSDSTTFELFIKAAYDLRGEFLSHGTEVEVLGPQWLRTEIAEIIAQQHARYNP